MNANKKEDILNGYILNDCIANILGKCILSHFNKSQLRFCIGKENCGHYQSY